MAQKLIGNLPGDFDLSPNFQIVVTAVDPSSGATVSGVRVSNIAIMAEPVTPTTAPETGPPFVPAAAEWLNLPVTG